MPFFVNLIRISVSPILLTKVEEDLRFPFRTLSRAGAETLWEGEIVGGGRGTIRCKSGQQNYPENSAIEIQVKIPVTPDGRVSAESGRRERE